MDVNFLALMLFAALVILLISGLPLVFVLGGLASLGGYYLLGTKAFQMVAAQSFAQMDSFITLAIPLFIFIGNLLEKSGIAGDAFDLMYKTLGRIRGGLAVGTVAVCTIMGAMTGTAAAATISMGVVALPKMLARKYDKHLAVGCITAGGTLGVLIPPSVLMVLYGLFANESVGRMFAGGVFSGIVMALVFCAYIIIRSYIKPDFCPAVPKEERSSAKEIFIATKGIILPILIILFVLGTIFFGIATPTEAAAVGCVGSLFCVWLRKTLNWKVFRDTTIKTLELSAMCIWIILGSSAFSAIFASTGAIGAIQQLFTSLPVTPYFILIAIIIIYLILGCFIDPGAIIMLTVPIFVPVIRDLGFNTLWFGVLAIAALMIGYLTPPFGFCLFYMKQIVPPGITMVDIYKSVVPFILLMILCLVIYTIFPGLILWLPGLVVV